MRRMLLDQIQKGTSIKPAIADCLPPNGRRAGVMAFLLLAVLAPLFAADTHAQTNTPATGEPTISGAPQVGETLTVNTSAIDDADGLGAFGYQWIRVDDGAKSNIPGATGGTYTPVEADQGKVIKVMVRFTDGAGNSETVTSLQHPTYGSVARAKTECPSDADWCAEMTTGYAVLDDVEGVLIDRGYARGHTWTGGSFGDLDDDDFSHGGTDYTVLSCVVLSPHSHSGAATTQLILQMRGDPLPNGAVVTLNGTEFTVGANSETEYLGSQSQEWRWDRAGSGLPGGLTASS